MIKTLIRTTALLIGSSLLLQGPVLAQNDALDFSLSSMVLFALHENPDIGIALSQQNQAGFSIDEARSALYPRLDFVAEGNFQYNNPAAGTTEPKKSNYNFGNEINLNFQQLLFDGFAASSTVKRRRSEFDAAGVQVDITTQDVITETVNNYIDIYQNQRSLDDIEVFLDVVNNIVEKVALMEEEGASSRVKLEYARSRLSAGKTQLTDVVSSLNDAVSNLEFLTGKLPEFRAQEPAELIIDDNTLQQFVDFGMKNNSDIRLNRANLDALKHDVSAQKGSFYPTVTFNLDGTRNSDDGGEVGASTEATASVRLEYQLLGIMGRRAVVNRSKSRANELVITENKIKKELKRDIQLAYNQIDSINQALIDTEDEIISNERLQELNRENFEFGDIDIIELIEGEERLISAKRRKYELEADMQRNTYELLLLIGYLDKGHFCTQC